MSVVPNKPVQTDPYKTLGLSHDATPTQIKVTYRKLALQYHPDRQTPHADSGDRDENIDKEKTDKFVEIAAAYALLSGKLQGCIYSLFACAVIFCGDARVVPLRDISI